ncbi:MAG: hypothetical protein U0359_38280 [Byssovorax sp.]
MGTENEFPGGPLNGQATTAQTTALSPPHIPMAPQLSVALNTSPVPKEEDVPNLEVDKVENIGKVLTQLQKRLQDGLAKVWEGPNGHDIEWDQVKSSDPNADVSAEGEQQLAEETWARWCSEMIVGVTYGTASLYGSDPYWGDKDYFRFFMDENPVIPIAMACQQLCTFALLSQGRQLFELTGPRPKASKKSNKPPPEPDVGVTAGSNASLAWIYDGKFETSSKFATLANAIKRKPPERGLTPGSLFCFSPGGEGQQQGSHVVFTLRVAPSIEKVQFLDTGAVNANAVKVVNKKKMGYKLSRSVLPEDGASPYAFRKLPGGAGNYDNQLFEGSISVILAKSGEVIPFVGLGVHKVLGAKSIITGVSMARRARPLGVARLGIFKRSTAASGKISDDDILYVSPTLPMHEAGATDNYYVSRFMWSLRTMPGYKDLQAIWQLSLPQHAFANTMREATRDMALKDIFAKRTPDLKNVIWLTVESDGRVTYLCRYKIETYKDEKDGKTKVRDATEPADGLDQYRALLKRMQSTPHGEQYLKESLGKLESVPPYFKPW